MLKDTAIFIKSYKGDLGWLAYCLKSIHKFFPHRRGVHVVLDNNCQLLTGDLDLEGVDLHFVDDPKYGYNGYIQQQAVKLMAHTYTEAKFIMMLDSDTLFKRVVIDDDYFECGRPIYFIQKYDHIYDHIHGPGVQEYRQYIEQLLGSRIEHEYMRSNPFVYDRQTLMLLDNKFPNLASEWLNADVCGPPSCAAPKQYSEFNLLGALAHLHHPNLYTWVDWPNNRPTMTFSSWHGLRDDALCCIKAILE